MNASVKRRRAARRGGELRQQVWLGGSDSTSRPNRFSTHWVNEAVRDTVADSDLVGVTEIVGVTVVVRDTVDVTDDVRDLDGVNDAVRETVGATDAVSDFDLVNDFVRDTLPVVEGDMVGIVQFSTVMVPVSCRLFQPMTSCQSVPVTNCHDATSVLIPQWFAEQPAKQYSSVGDTSYWLYSEICTRNGTTQRR